jgi:hypothetical protein
METILPRCGVMSIACSGEGVNQGVGRACAGSVSPGCQGLPFTNKAWDWFVYVWKLVTQRC